MNEDDPLLDHLLGLERALHSPAMRQDPVQLDALLADDVAELGRPNCYDKAAVRPRLAGTSPVPDD